MNISSKTLTLLKNAATINSSILIKPGNKVNTISEAGDTLLKAEVDESFPIKFGIYDLNQFLGTLTLIGDQDITFGSKSLIIKSGDHSIEYFYAGDGMVNWDDKWEKPTGKIDSYFDFSLSDKDLTLIQKSASIFGASSLSVVGDGTSVNLVVGNPDISSSNNYKKVLGSCSDAFNYKLGLNTLKVVSDTYTVSLPKGKPRLYFKGEGYSTQYWLACAKDSEV